MIKRNSAFQAGRDGAFRLGDSIGRKRELRWECGILPRTNRNVVIEPAPTTECENIGAEWTSFCQGRCNIRCIFLFSLLIIISNI